MKTLFTVLLLSAGLISGVAHADPTAQQAKMTSCNADAKAQGKTGDDRKAFMKDCLSAKPAEAAASKALTPQQQKMKDCNADAKAQGKTGADRKTFLSQCLKKQ